MSTWSAGRGSEPLRRVDVINGERCGGQPADRSSAPSDCPGPISTTASSSSASSTPAAAANWTGWQMRRAQYPGSVMGASTSSPVTFDRYGRVGG